MSRRVTFRVRSRGKREIKPILPSRYRSTFWVDVLLLAIGASAVGLLFFGSYYR